MRMRFRWLLLLAGLVLTPAVASAQMEAPPVLFTGPLSHVPYNGPGVYVGFQMLYMKTNRPMRNQIIAKRGFIDLDGSVGGIQNQFIGSGDFAVETYQVIGTGNFQPGWDMFIGYKFQNGVAIELGWRHLVQARYSSVATILPPDFNSGVNFENTFLTSPVTNFTTDWAGNPLNLPVGTTATTFGIWNAATIMQIEYTQRYDIYQINARLPIWQTDYQRVYGLFGPRIAWLWDRFQWRTVDVGVDGVSGPDTTAIYSNTISNRMYGIHAGFGNDWYLGTTPIGGFSCLLDIEGGLYLNLPKTRAAYERGDRAVSATRARRHATLVPGAEARLGLKWYPWEAISVEIAYDVQTYFNTITSNYPVDFNMGSLDPEYNRQFFRWFYGLRIGISFVF